MKFAGRYDAFSLGCLGVSVSSMNPLLWSMPIELCGGLSFVGMSGVLAPRAVDFLDGHLKRRTDGIVIRSNKPPKKTFMTEGYRYGLTRDYSEPVDLIDDLAVRHTAIIGQSGVGKTTLAMYILTQQMARGGGFLFIDGKIDDDTLRQLSYLAKLYGREDELYVLNVSDPSNSNSYSPLMHGDADEKSSRLLNLQEAIGNADHYLQSAGHAFRVVFDALDCLGYCYTFEDFVTILNSSEALISLEDELTSSKPHTSELLALSNFLELYKTVDRNGKKRINVDNLKKNIGGMVSRLTQFASGKFGQVFNTYNPEIDLFDIITQGQMLYVMVPTMAKDTAALNLAKMILSDLRSVVAKVQELPKSQRPSPSFICLPDELGSYAIDAVRTLFEQGRSAGIQMIPSFQSFSQLNMVSDYFSDIIIQNTWNKVFFKFGSKDAPEDAAEILGKQSGFLRTITESESESSSMNVLRTNPDSNAGDGHGVAEGWREQEEFRVEPDDLRGLGMGQAIMQIGAKVYCLDTPMIEFPKHLPAFEKNIYPVAMPAGLTPMNMGKKYMKMILRDT